MRFTSIASGSSGNASYIGTDNTHILVDVGVTMKAINEGLHAMNLDLRDIQAIFLTHEHIDHIRAVGTISRKYGIPIYSTLETLRETLLNKTLGAVPKEMMFPIQPDEAVTIGDLAVTPFTIDHDAANPVGYRMEETETGKKAAVATDLGHFDAYIQSNLRGVNAMVLEANHDIAMLNAGPYPLSLKRRILSDHGHLSNENSGRLLDQVLHSELRHVFLGHLSAENNLPELALRTVREQIDQSDSEYHAKDFDITVASRNHVSEMIEF